MTIKKCQCGIILTGKQKVRCSQCSLKLNPGSSQCAHCFQWYISHGGNSHRKERELHATAKCKKAEGAA